MAKSKNISTRGLLYIFAAVLALVIIGVAATANDDDRNKRDRDERGVRALVSLKANVNGSIKANDTNVRITNDMVNVKGCQSNGNFDGGLYCDYGHAARHLQRANG